MKIPSILERNGTDKQCGHKYGMMYEFLLEDFRKTNNTILEIGIDQGRSIRAWREIFPFAVIVGIDMRPECMIKDEKNIVTHICDVNDVEAMVNIANLYGPFQVIIDDGSHKLTDQIIALSVLRPFLAQNGLYIIEDVMPKNAEVLRKIPGSSMYEAIAITGCADECLIVYKR